MRTIHCRRSQFMLPIVFLSKRLLILAIVGGMACRDIYVEAFHACIPPMHLQKSFRDSTTRKTDVPFKIRGMRQMIKKPMVLKMQNERNPLQDSDVDGNNNVKESTKIYFDIAIGNKENKLGRLVFNLFDSPKLLPLHAENIIKLATGEMRSIDPRCGYVNCQFKHSPQFVEGFPQYRWAHVLDGKGRNAVGRPTERIVDPDGLRNCAHSIYGGVYYGLKYRDGEGDEDGSGNGDDQLGKMGDAVGAGVVLSVPLVGAYRGSTSFSIVRVGESPQEWRERLLLNSAILGYLESGMDVLHQMARQTEGAPTIISSGKI